MSEAPSTLDLKGTVSFTRKVSDGNYGSTEFFHAVQYDIPDPSDGEAIVAAANAAATIAKAVVFEQLGIEHTLDESGVVVEVVRRAFPGSVVEPAAAQAAPAGGNEPPYPANTTDAAQKKANKEWAEALYATNPAAFYDNRAKKASGEFSAKSPDVKHKASGIGLWFS